MTITRSGLASEIIAYDEQVTSLNEAKAECYKAYREQLLAEGATKGEAGAEIKAFKAALRHLLRQKANPIAAERHEALVEEIIAEISGVGDNGTTLAFARGTREESELALADPEPDPLLDQAEPFPELPHFLRRSAA